MKKFIDLFFLCICLCLCSCSLIRENNGSIPEYKDKSKVIVRKVIDGDTIVLTNNEKVRYIGINAPERNQNCYKEAFDLNSSLVSGKEVYIEYDTVKKDQYGRLLGYIYIDSVFVNQEIIEAGLAFVYHEHGSVKYMDELLAAEKEAKQKGIGIWTKSTVKIKISNIHYNAQGKDEENVNGEWIDITNLSNKSTQLDGFILQDESNNQFFFPKFVINPNSFVRIYSGKGANSKEFIYWGSSHPIWNNDGDTVFLYDANKRFIDSKSYPYN